MVTLPGRFISHITAVHGPKRVFDFLSHPVPVFSTESTGDVQPSASHEAVVLMTSLDIAARAHLKGAPASFESVLASFMDTCRDADRVLEFAEILGAMVKTKKLERDEVNTATNAEAKKNEDVDSMISSQKKKSKDVNVDGNAFGKKKKNDDDAPIVSLTFFDCIKWVMLFLVWILCSREE